MLAHPHPRIEALLQRLVHPSLPVIELSLQRAQNLLQVLGNPQHRLPPVLHVAGTNGKGSLLAFLTAIFEAAGLRVHRYISPHLVRFNERIYVAGQEIEDAWLFELLDEVATHTEHHPVTFFEATTAAAFLAFSRMPADIVLLETGMGGRLDATNLVEAPALTAITPVSYDHKEFLGNTLTAIAGEKAGILKPSSLGVIGYQEPEALLAIEQAAFVKGVSLFRAGSEWHLEQESELYRYRSAQASIPFTRLGLAGVHQYANAATALACVECWPHAQIDEETCLIGLAEAQWPARLQPLTEGALASLLPVQWSLWLDGGHNPSAGLVLAEWMASRQQPVHVIMGMLRNKELGAFLRPLVAYTASLYGLAIPGESACHEPRVIYDTALALGIQAHCVDTVTDAINSIIKSNNNGDILICGSLYLAGHILWLNNKNAQ